MGYIENNLVRDEHIAFRTRLHWWTWVSDIFLGGVFTVLALLLVPLFIPRSIPGKATVVDGGLALIVLCIVPVVLLSFFLAFIRDLITWSTSELGVTNRRILAKKGWIRRQIAEINLSQFESCQLSESLFGRLLGYKTVILTGSGGTREAFRLVANAKDYRNHIMEQVDLNNRSMRQYPLPQQPSQPSYQQSTYSDPLFDLPPEDPTAQLREASAFIKAGKRNEAGQIVRGLLQTHPQNADVWYLAGYLQTDQNKKRTAYEKALRFNPQHKLAQAGLSNLH